MSSDSTVWDFLGFLRGIIDNTSTFALSYVLYKTDSETFCKCNSLNELLSSFMENSNISELRKKDVSFLGSHLFGSKHENNLYDFIEEFYHKLSKDDFKTIMLQLYEYFKNGGKTSGISGTPWGVAYLGTHILNIQEKDVVADMCSGVGNFLFCAANNYDSQKYYGVEINAEAKAICSIIAEINNFDVEIFNTDVFKLEQTFKFNKGFCEAPINMKFNLLESEYRKYPEIYNINSGDSMFMMCGIEHLEDNGTFVFIEPTGFLTSTAHYEMRKYLVEQGYLSAVIQLPKRLLSYSSVSITMIVISKDKHDSVMFVNAESYFTKSRLGRNELSTDNIEDIYNLYLDESENSKKVTFDAIRVMDYNITPIKYLKKCRIDFGDEVPYEKLGSMCEISRGLQVSASELDDLSSIMETDYQYLGLSSIENNTIPKDLPYITELGPKAMKYTLKENDLVLPMAITSPLKCAIAKDLNNKTILVASNLYIIRFNTKLILPGFVKALFESDKTYKLLQSFSSGSVMQSLSVELLNDIEIPIPSIEEQEKILAQYSEIEEEEKALISKLNSLSEVKRTYFERNLGGK